MQARECDNGVAPNRGGWSRFRRSPPAKRLLAPVMHAHMAARAQTIGAKQLQRPADFAKTFTLVSAGLIPTRRQVAAVLFF